MPSVDDLSEEEFMTMLRKPEIGLTRRSDRKDVEPSIPEYIVRPASYRTLWNPSQSIKIIDFRESFLRTTVPRTLYTPLPIPAPEIIFQDRIDYLNLRVWQLFELFIGQPPFDIFLLTPKILVDQMLDIATDDLPERWQNIRETMNAGDSKTTEITGPSLQQWLEDMYFDCALKPNLTREAIASLGHIIGRLLRLEPSARASARDILNDPWFKE
ncbi:protein kinase [Penicillium capsulatum]|uniref:Protein kinase n=1 Tax=Penicillium capsulatum TaxID=69766 RepID=A0A9W9IBV8_9EURO|nr:protein kinase [Penicillium capsulatum]KAJ6135521.1 protein kinase [Penicillium capsulatum]